METSPQVNEPQSTEEQTILSSGKFLGGYVLFNFILFFVLVRLSRICVRVLDDVSMTVLMILYFSMVAGLYIAWGVKYSDKDTANTLHHKKTVLPVVIIGIVLWFYSLLNSHIVKSDFGDISWIIYMLYTVWAVPFFEYLQVHEYVGSSLMVCVGLLASFIPGCAYLLGVWLPKLYHTASKVEIWKALVMLSSILYIIFLVLRALPSTTPFTLQTYPQIDGALATERMRWIMAREFTGMNPWQANEQARYNNTHQAYVNLIEKNVDIIFVVGPTNEELKLAAEKNIQLRLTPVAKDALIFLAHRRNPVGSLTIQQIQDIYAGKLDNWQNIEGLNAPIIAYQQPKNSDSEIYMENIVMQGKKLTKPPMQEEQRLIEGAVSVVTEYKNVPQALGYALYYMATETRKRENVKFLSVEGIECNKENIKDGAYPFTFVIYAVTREDEPADSSANKLLMLLASDAGKAIIERAGYVPVIDDTN